ncbi:MAG: PEP-CTERM sorting domain-containing protein [Planctomycetota bacterium]
MRESLVLLLAILALPGFLVSQVESASYVVPAEVPFLDVGIGGVPGGSVVATAAPITFDVLVSSPIALDGAQYNLSAELSIGGVPQGPGSGDGLINFDAVTPWINGVVFTGLGGDYTQLIGVGTLPPGSSMAAYNAEGPELYFKNFGSTSAPLTAALMAQYVINVASLNPGDSLAITAGGSNFGNGYITDGGGGGGPWAPGVPLIITPEPASILLLLGALLFLRRRR